MISRRNGVRHFSGAVLALLILMVPFRLALTTSLVWRSSGRGRFGCLEGTGEKNPDGFLCDINAFQLETPVDNCWKTLHWEQYFSIALFVFFLKIKTNYYSSKL